MALHTGFLEFIERTAVRVEDLTELAERLASISPPVAGVTESVSAAAFNTATQAIQKFGWNVVMPRDGATFWSMISAILSVAAFIVALGNEPQAPDAPAIVDAVPDNRLKLRSFDHGRVDEIVRMAVEEQAKKSEGPASVRQAGVQRGARRKPEQSYWSAKATRKAERAARRKAARSR